MQKKIEQAKRLADKIALAQVSQEEKFQRIQDLDRQNEEILREKAMKVEFRSKNIIPGLFTQKQHFELVLRKWKDAAVCVAVCWCNRAFNI